MQPFTSLRRTLAGLRNAAYRGYYYGKSQGWRRFLRRLLQVWLWLPRLRRSATSRRGASSAPAAPLAFGVNLTGNLTEQSGLGQAARLGWQALNAAGVPVALGIENDARSPWRSTEMAAAEAFDNPHYFNLVWLPLETVEEFARRKGPDYFPGHYNIGFWAWETPRLPRLFARSLHFFDEIWVPSAFVQAALSKVTRLPVRTFPHPLPLPEAEAASPPAAFTDLPADAFVFLFVFNFYSHVERKNPAGAIEAFKRAFSPSENVHLLIKTANVYDQPAFAALQQSARGANVRIIDEPMTRAEVDSLYRGCDCYVSLHRAEGFGLTLTEAMAAGKPVIATGYSGNLQFMNPQNAYLVGYRLTRLDRRLDAFEKGTVWAEPDIGHAASLMRHVYERRDEARGIGERARGDVVRELSAETIGAAMRERLLEVWRERREATPPSSSASAAPRTAPPG